MIDKIGPYNYTKNGDRCSSIVKIGTQYFSPKKQTYGQVYEPTSRERQLVGPAKSIGRIGERDCREVTNTKEWGITITPSEQKEIHVFALRGNGDLVECAREIISGISFFKPSLVSEQRIMMYAGEGKRQVVTQGIPRNWFIVNGMKSEEKQYDPTNDDTPQRPLNMCTARPSAPHDSFFLKVLQSLVLQGWI
jgi:hypothetical protein